MILRDWRSNVTPETRDEAIEAALSRMSDIAVETGKKLDLYLVDLPSPGVVRLVIVDREWTFLSERTSHLGWANPKGQIHEITFIR